MPEDAWPNGGALAVVVPDGGVGEVDAVVGPRGRVLGMQAKLHRWAAADPGRRFNDLFNLVCDPATLQVAFDRVAGNTGARTAGVDGRTVAYIEQQVGVRVFLDDLRSRVKAGEFVPCPVRERTIPKPGGSGKVRRLGIPTVADRVVQAALKLVLEPIFEADFLPVSYGFRPNRRAHDAIAEVHHFGSHGYRWVLDADIEACFDSLSHSALMDRVRTRVGDKRVLRLVKAFLKAGVLTELGQHQDTETGTPQGGILSPLLANIALSALDEALMADWQPGRAQSTEQRRATRRAKGSPTWRVIRYADDFVVMVNGNREHVEHLRDEVSAILAPLGLRLSPAKTRIAHLADGIDFLGFHLQWRRKRGTTRWYVYTFIADRPIKALKAKIRAMTNKSSKADPGTTLIRLGQIMRGWANYFRYAVCKRALSTLADFAWWRVARWLIKLHRWTWKDFRRNYTDRSGRWEPLSAGGVRLFDIGAVPVRRYRYRGQSIPLPWTQPDHA